MKKNKILYETKEYKDIKEMIQDTVKKYKDNIAFTLKEKIGENISYKEITYSQMYEDVKALGTALISLGLKDKRIAIISNNRYEWCISYIATLCGVGVIVPLDKSLPEGEIESLLQRSYSDAVIFENKYDEIMKKIKLNNNTKIKYYISMNKKEDEENAISLEKLINNGKKLLNDGNREYEEAKIDEEKMSVILFTSGTTSVSKAVMLSHKNIISNINSLNAVVKVYKTDKNLAFLPLHHTFGSTAQLFFMNNGATTAFCDGLKHIQQNLKEYKITIFVCVPLLLEAMNKKILKEIDKKGKTKLIKIVTKITNILLKVGIDIRRKVFKEIINNLGGELRLAVSGAAGIDKTVAKNFNDFGIRTIQGYGLTETSPVLTAENDKYIKYGSVGFPLKDVEIKIDNPNEEKIGEIIAKGPNIMLGYYENEEATNEVLKNGWFYTGDLGYIDDKGYLFITGRKKNVIVMKNGKNIYPEELELLVSKLPYVSENMIFGIPTKEEDLDLGLKIVYNKEYVEETYPNIEIEKLKDIIWSDIKKINKTMPPYKYVRELYITDEPMIKTTTQKIKRFEEIKKILQNN
ncbi:MAG: AMP-binding protein [Clostridia bacterium]|jgi:long-chain acyl-CoA synthetase|nr:AMP-binding protein [Clostridia bacterium]